MTCKLEESQRVSGSRQSYFFPEPRPLVDTLGVEFFRSIPEKAGVYFMKDASEQVIYIGKAKNLRKRLNSYRVANSDKRSKRLLRLLNQVRRIEFEECVDESFALAKEAELLQFHKPKFNRAGTWPSKPRFISWSATEDWIETKLTLVPEFGCDGPFKPSIIGLHRALIRVLFISLHPTHSFASMPMGWFDGQFPESVQISKFSFSGNLADVLSQITTAFLGQSDPLVEWVREQTASVESLFDKAVLEEDIALIQEACLTVSSKRIKPFD